MCVYVCFGIYMHNIFLLRNLFFTCFASFYYLVIHSILFHYIHAFLWIHCAPLIIFDHLYISRVKRSSFLYPLSIMTKRGRNYGDFVVSFLKILHVRGRNTCLCKGEMCFILLGGVLTSFLLYTGLVTMFTYIVLIFDDVCFLHLSLHVLVCLLHLTLHVLFLFYLYTYVSTCMQSIISVSHKDALMSFVSSVSEIQVVKVYL